MRVAVCCTIAVLLAAVTAQGETFYRYRDRSTKRDVFVNRLDQVPLQYRGETKQLIIDETGARNEAAKLGSSPEEASTENDGTLDVASSSGHWSALRERRSIPLGWQGLRDGTWLAQEVNRHLGEAGHPMLTEGEIASFLSLAVWITLACALAALALFVAWVVLLVHAIRNARSLWAVAIFLFYPLGSVYLFLHIEKGRVWTKGLCLAGLLSPVLVLAVSAWRGMVWIQAAIASRGGIS